MAKKARRTTQGRFKDIQTFKRGAWAGHQAAGEGGEVADRHQRDNVALRTCAVQSTVCWVTTQRVFFIVAHDLHRPHDRDKLDVLGCPQ